MAKKGSVLNSMDQALVDVRSGLSDRGAAGALGALGGRGSTNPPVITQADMLKMQQELAKQARGAGTRGSTGDPESVGPEDVKRDKLRQLPTPIIWYNQFITMLDDILEKKELSINQLEWVPTFVRSLAELVDFGGRRKVYEGYKNSFWRCIHRVDSLIFQDHEFMKQLRQMLCEARQMRHPDVGKTWAEIAKEEEGLKDKDRRSAYDDRPGEIMSAMDEAMKRVGF